VDSPFEVLGIAPDADEEDVDRAYRRRVKEAHPDQGGSLDEFQAVRTAYERITAGDVEAYPDVDVDVDVGSDDSDDDSDDEAEVGAGPKHRDTARERSAPDPTRTEDDDDREDDSNPEENARVEYLNYDVLADLGGDLDAEDPFETVPADGLDAPDHGTFDATIDDTLLESAEDEGFAWPFACRGGACTNCAVAVVEGELSMPVNHVLPPEMLDRGIRLSCVGSPTTDSLKIIYNMKHLPALDDLRLPPSRFERARSDD
jgi:curved DNA-binding protein CbpA